MNSSSDILFERRGTAGLVTLNRPQATQSRRHSPPNAIGRAACYVGELLKPLADEAVAEAFETARLEAAGETDLELDTFPLECPYSWHEIMERPIDWPPK